MSTGEWEKDKDKFLRYRKELNDSLNEPLNPKMVTLQALEGSLILTPNMKFKECLEILNKWYNEKSI